MRNDYAKSSPKFVHFDEDVDALVSKKVWSYYRPRKNVEQYLLGSDGYVYIMQKLWISTRSIALLFLSNWKYTGEIYEISYALASIYYCNQ